MKKIVIPDDSFLKTTIKFNKNRRPNLVARGNSIWGDTKNFKSKVNSITFEIDSYDNKPHVYIFVNHTSNAWWIYTDSGITNSVAKILSKLMKKKVRVIWTEQGMQEERKASLQCAMGNDNKVYEWLEKNTKIKKYSLY